MFDLRRYEEERDPLRLLQEGLITQEQYDQRVRAQVTEPAKIERAGPAGMPADEQFLAGAGYNLARTAAGIAGPLLPPGLAEEAEDAYSQMGHAATAGALGVDLLAGYGTMAGLRTTAAALGLTGRWSYKAVQTLGTGAVGALITPGDPGERALAGVIWGAGGLLERYVGKNATTQAAAAVVARAAPPATVGEARMAVYGAEHLLTEVMPQTRWMIDYAVQEGAARGDRMLQAQGQILEQRAQAAVQALAEGNPEPVYDVAALARLMHARLLGPPIERLDPALAEALRYEGQQTAKLLSGLADTPDIAAARAEVAIALRTTLLATDVTGKTVIPWGQLHDGLRQATRNAWKVMADQLPDRTLIAYRGPDQLVQDVVTGMDPATLARSIRPLIRRMDKRAFQDFARQAERAVVEKDRGTLLQLIADVDRKFSGAIDPVVVREGDVRAATLIAKLRESAAGGMPVQMEPRLRAALLAEADEGLATLTRWQLTGSVAAADDLKQFILRNEAMFAKPAGRGRLVRRHGSHPLAQMPGFGTAPPKPPPGVDPALAVRNPATDLDVAAYLESLADYAVMAAEAGGEKRALLELDALLRDPRYAAWHELITEAIP